MSFFAPSRPYPADRYDREEGENLAWWRLNNAPHDIQYAAGGSCDYLAIGTATHGDYGLYRWNMGPGRSGPDPHFHRAVSESFFVLDGAVAIYDGTKWRTGRQGDFCYVPEGGVHAFRNDSGEPASMLILFSPGAAREKYFEGLAHLTAADTPPSDDEMAEFFTAHDTHWL
ncbi:MAG: cupin domain-containing protein [Jatrophihabitans sp.]